MANVSTALGRAWTWWRRGGWYFAVVLGSFGILSPIPYAHAATWLRDARLWAWTALYATGVATVFVLADAAPKDATGRPEGGLLTTVQVLLTLALWTVPCLQLRSVRRGPAASPSRIAPTSRARTPSVSWGSGGRTSAAATTTAAWSSSTPHPPRSSPTSATCRGSSPPDRRRPCRRRRHADEPRRPHGVPRPPARRPRTDPRPRDRARRAAGPPVAVSPPARSAPRPRRGGRGGGS